MVCKRCGAELKDKDKFCPVCGEPIEKKIEVTPEPNVVKETTTPQEVKSDSNETMSLVFGIISFFTCWLGIFFAIAAIILGSKTKKETGKMPAGMICGIISLSINVLLILIYIFIYIFATILGVN